MAAEPEAVPVDQDNGQKTLAQSLERAGNPAEFIFDEALSRTTKANGPLEAKAPNPKYPHPPAIIGKMNRYCRAGDYLRVGKVHLFGIRLLRKPFKTEQVKPELLGNRGTSSGQTLIHIHLNRLSKEHDADIVYIAGSGPSGPLLNADSYLEGSYIEVHPEITPDENALHSPFRNFATPKVGMPSRQKFLAARRRLHLCKR